MPVDLFTIVSKGPNQIVLDRATRKGTLVFSVSNKLDRDVNMRAKAKPQKEGIAALKVSPDTRAVKVGETTSVSVEITADAKAEPGSYGLELLAWDDDAPSEYSSKGPVAQFEIPKPGEPVVPGWRKWLWLIILGGVVVLGAIGFVVWKVTHDGPKLPALHDPCAPPSPGPQCGSGLKCVTVQAAVVQCLRVPDSSCSNDLECSSLWCRDGKCNRDDGGCQTNADCRLSTLVCASGRCKTPNGGTCAHAADCESNYCRAHVCGPTPACTLFCVVPNRCQFNDDGLPFCGLVIRTGIDTHVFLNPDLQRAAHELPKNPR